MSPCQCFDKLEIAKRACRKQEEEASKDVNSLTLKKAHQTALGSGGRRACSERRKQGKG